jgi:hypothetical protein
VSSQICAVYCAAGAAEPRRPTDAQRHFPVNRMARLSASAPRPAAPILTLDQKRYRVERFRVCIKRLEDFDPETVRRRVGVPEVVTLEAGIDNALSATFGYGTPSYFRFNLAARLDSGPLMTSTVPESTGQPSAGASAEHDGLAAQEARNYFREGKARSILLLREAIAVLEGELSAARNAVGVAQGPNAIQTSAQRHSLWQELCGGFTLKAAWHRMKQWCRTSDNEASRPRSR